MQKQGTKIAVRPLHPGDIPAIYDLLAHSFMIGNVPYDPGIELSFISEWLAKRDPGVHRYVAMADGEISGLLILTHKMRPRLNHSGTISMVAHSTNRYEETRQALLAAALDLADNWLNLYRVDLELSTEAKTVIDYFQSIGFESKGTRVIAVYRDGRWLNQLFMARLRINPHWLESSEKKAPIEPGSKPNKPRQQIEKIEIRPANIGDVNAFYEMMRDPAICRTTLQLPSQEIWQTEERLKKIKLLAAPLHCRRRWPDRWQHRACGSTKPRSQPYSQNRHEAPPGLLGTWYRLHVNEIGDRPG
jgi:putative acetyltransferase